MPVDRLTEPNASTPAAEGEALPPPETLQFDLADHLPEAVRPAWETLVAYPWLLVPLLLLLGWAIGKALQFSIEKGLSQLTRRTESKFDDDLIQLLSRPVLPVAVTLSAMLSMTILPVAAGVQTFVNRVLASILLLIVMRTGLRAMRIVLEALSRNRDKFRIIEERTLPLFDMVSKILLIGAIVYALFLVWGIDPTAWLASAGIIGIAVGFAARDTLANLFAGMFIVADAPYKIGDYIVLDTGDRGMVTHVGMRSTRILTRDDLEITVPNSRIANAKLINESGGPWLKSRIRVKVGVAYGSDLERVCKVLELVADEHTGVVSHPSPRVRLREFGDSSVNFELMGWIEHPEKRGLVTHQVMMAVYKRLREEGIEIPYPKRDVYVRQWRDDEGLGPAALGGGASQD